MTSASSSKPPLVSRTLAPTVAASPRQQGPVKAWVPWGIGLAVAVIILNFLIFPWLAESGAYLLRLVYPPAQTWIPALGGRVSDGLLLGLYIVASAMTVAFLMVWIRVRYRLTLAVTGLRWFKPGRSLLYVVGVLAVFLFLLPYVMEFILLLFPSFNPTAVQTVPYQAATGGGFTAIQLIGLVIMPPIIEELMFRGVIFPGLARRLGGVGGALASSALFALAHINYQAEGLQLNVAVYTFVLGLLLCFMYVRLKSIVPGTALHMANNFLALLAMTAGR